MSDGAQNIEESFEKLETVVSAAADKIIKLKRKNKELKGEANELKRLLALSEKKADRLKQELKRAVLNDEKSWRIREEDIKHKLVQLSAKLSAFEKSYTMES